MNVTTILPILVAGIVSAMIGFIWYHPRVFGGLWLRLSGITPESVERGKKRMPAMALTALLASVLVAYILRWLLGATGTYGVLNSIQLAALMWIGFIAPALLGIVLWEQKPIALYLINAFYWLAALVAMSLVLIL